MKKQAVPRLVRLSADDNVAVAVKAIESGDVANVEGRTITAAQPIPAGHKVALDRIAAGQKVLKYGLPIGTATSDITPGEHVHSHNLKTDYV